MGFWNSREHKARKEHTCIYCNKTIEVGESYSRESGLYEGEFNDYCLCLRCLWLINNYAREDDYLTDMRETLFENDLISCPSCGSYSLVEFDEIENYQKAECECNHCYHTWVEDISLENLKTKQGV